MESPEYKDGYPLVTCTDINCRTCLQDEPRTWDHVTLTNPHMTNLPNQACPVCGTWGYHNCLGYRPPTNQIQVTIPVDWNRAINIFDRLVTLLERHFGENKNEKPTN